MTALDFLEQSNLATCWYFWCFSLFYFSATWLRSHLNLEASFAFYGIYHYCFYFLTLQLDNKSPWIPITWLSRVFHIFYLFFYWDDLTVTWPNKSLWLHTKNTTYNERKLFLMFVYFCLNFEISYLTFLCKSIPIFHNSR